ncbi:hypothetical protein AGOR_G00200750 [Albula goreensis]|uniref:Ciliary-associated calcium-binding coiled-coil protein 1 n=1 Tax=Albula goreensis TaxID=1534307 RepID=A0A8T3CSH4_9TELE|nr:hypothetical protein AGOR_G00200750 [Albula goreensis]
MAGRKNIKPNEKSQMSDSKYTGSKPEEDDLNENDANGKENLCTEWKLLSLDKVNILLALTVEEVQLEMEDILSLKQRQTCVKEAALIDYFVSGFWWAKEMNFTCQQISCFMALLQLLLDNIREKQMSLVDNFTELTKVISGMRRPMSPNTFSPLFDVDQAISITDYLKSSLFQHYKLYEFLFTQPREELLFTMEEHIEVISTGDFVAPLEEGMPADVFFDYMTQAPLKQAEEVIKEVEQHDAELKTRGPAEVHPANNIQEDSGQVNKAVPENQQADTNEKPRVKEKTTTKERLKKTSSK